MLRPRQLNTQEAAEYIGLNAALLYRLRKTGGGPRFFQIGRVVRYDPTDLDLWLEANKRSEAIGADE
jgi:predicted DNA-binding transcriptional regulator AlpA